MRVICINNEGYPLSLKLRAEYTVHIVEENFYVIVDEYLEDQRYPLHLFEIIEDSI